MCRSRRELSNAYLLAKIGVDTAENEPLEVWGKIQFTIHFTPWSAHVGELTPFAVAAAPGARTVALVRAYGHWLREAPFAADHYGWELVRKGEASFWRLGRDDVSVAPLANATAFHVDSSSTVLHMRGFASRQVPARALGQN